METGFTLERICDSWSVGRKEARPDQTLAGLREGLIRRGLTVTEPAIWYYPERMSLSHKKVLHAAEQDRPDVVTARAAWKAEQPFLDPDRLAFIDETGASTNMVRRYGRCPVGGGVFPQTALTLPRR
jgi:hypothetical protein